MIIVCLKCSVGIRIISEDLKEMELLVGTKSEYWPNQYPCYKCGKMASGVHEAEISADASRALSIIDLSVHETYAALNGLGVPSEQTCCREVLEQLLESSGIKLHGRQLRGQTRFIVDRLELADGTMLYFGASSQGAAIYRIVKPHHYTKQLLDGIEANSPELQA